MDTPSTAFLTDFYEVTMLQAMMEAGNAFKPAVFDLFARRLPKGRRYGVVAGTARAIEAIKSFRYTDEQLEFLASQPTIKPETVEFLRNYSFKGKVVGIPEGSLYFPNTPVVTVSGTFADCVLLETLLLSIFNHDTAVASAASRMVVAAEGKPLIEMARWRNKQTTFAIHSPIPVSSIEKKPSAELKPDQFDTDSLPPYDILDPLIEALTVCTNPAELYEEYGKEMVDDVFRKMVGAEWKRRQTAFGANITDHPLNFRDVPVTITYKPLQ